PGDTMKTFDKRPLVTALAASLLAIGTAYAQNTTQPTGPGTGALTGKGGSMAIPASPNAARSGMWDAEMFQRLDTNHDGMISRDEAQADAAVRDAWSKLDSKNAGRVTRDEFDRFGQSQAQSSPSGTSALPSTSPSGSMAPGNSGSAPKKY
ncbi:MAG TPA: EF-hand domain-containing protein, partial [Casimicrobiaceae bacterium]|nr:EF-hand domain-containing protein [Casimicrobiaceae bacterium]